MPSFQPYWGKPAVRGSRRRRHHSKPGPRLDPTRLRGAPGNGRSYRDHLLSVSENGAGGRARFLTRSGDRDPPCGGTEITRMTQDQKIIRAKVGLLELAKQLGNVSQACKMMGYSRD